VAHYDRETAELYYRNLREEAFREIERSYRFLQPPIMVDHISARALGAWRDEWVRRHKGNPWDWDWEERRREFRNVPSRLEIALWSGDVLCGLAIGRPSAKKTCLEMRFMARRWGDDNPLQGNVMPLIADVSIEYAYLLGSATVRIWRPYPEMVPHYVAFGFHCRDDVGPPYCELVL
jgi:hypothetical protein